MCEFSEKLIAALDGELPQPESEALARHLDQCAACAAAMHSYRDASRAFADCCDAIYVGKFQQKPKRLWPRFAAAAAVAAAAALMVLFFLPRSPSKPRAFERATVKSIPAAINTQPVAATRRALTVKRKHVRPAPAPPPVPSIRIAIPADAVFPPGVFPEGVAILADLSLGADGTPSSLRLHP